MKAIPLPTSRALPPPNAITPSQSFILYKSTPSVMFLPNGFPEKLEKILKDLNTKNFPLMFSMLSTICDNKKLEINW